MSRTLRIDHDEGETMMGAWSRRGSLCAVAIAVTLFLGAARLAAQSAGHGGHDERSAAAGVSGETCEAAFENALLAGTGFGMALPAERNGYPGPTHVLALASKLGLTADQERSVRAAMTEMSQQARTNGQQVLEAERRLQEVFAKGTADQASVRAAVLDVERARAEVRMSHLTAHLHVRDVLTPEQRRIYHAERGHGH